MHYKFWYLEFKSYIFYIKLETMLDEEEVRRGKVLYCWSTWNNRSVLGKPEWVKEVMWWFRTIEMEFYLRLCLIKGGKSDEDKVGFRRSR